MAALVATFAGRWGLTGRAAPAVDWTFTVEVVAGLTHPGPDGKPAPAWAVVDPRVSAGPGDFPGGHAHVQIRDIDATPIPGFDGDPIREIRVTVAHEMGHAVVAEAVAKSGGKLTIPAEEQIVETAAQAIVRSEGTPDARVMARAVREAVPSALRARISASAGQRARGGAMEEQQITEALEALEAGDAEKSAQILKAIIAALAVKGSGGTPTPGGTEPDGDEYGKTEPVPPEEQAPGAPMGKTEGGPPPMEQARTVARKGANVETEDQKRARVAREEIETIAADARTAAKDNLIANLRARLAGHDGLPAIEKRVLAAPTYDAAKTIADVAIEMGGGVQRARSGVEHKSATENANGACPFTVKDLTAQGISEVQASEIVGQWSIPKLGPKLAEQSLQHARARLNPSASPFMPTTPVNGAAKGS